jgi:GNAT superfamily N-acetyltransferase
MVEITNSPVTVQIQPVNTLEAAEQFLDVPHLVYANDPNWVPPLRSSIAKQFAPENPFFTYGRLQRFIACTQDGKAVGRIAAIVNDRLVQKEQKAIGLFGYFECIDAADVAMALLEAACEWLREQGMEFVRGPINLSTHNSCLFLVDGFDSPPYVMMPYNPPYYPEFIEQAGWQKAKDAYAYTFLKSQLTAEYERAYQIALKSGVTFRSLHLKGEGFQKDVIGLYELFTKAFTDNWSSTPRTQEEFIEEAKSLQTLVDPDIFWIAEVQDEMIGFFMALPDYNLALKHVNGKLNWLGILKFLWYRRSIDQVRVIAICVLPEYRRKMVAPALIYTGLQGGIKNKKLYKQAELSWVYEDNILSRRVIEGVNAKISKTYRMYEKPL